MLYLLDNVEAPAAVTAFMQTLLHWPYSSEDPTGSYDDGHLWVPGDLTPTKFCCSGFEHYCWLKVTGLQISPLNAFDQWEQKLGGVVPPEQDLLLGDTLYFNGANPPVGHTGTCLTYNPRNGQGTFISALNSQLGVTTTWFSRESGYGPGGFVGALRTANALPKPPAPKPAPILSQRLLPGMQWTPNVPSDKGDWLFYQGKKCGIPNGADLTVIKQRGIKEASPNLTEAELQKLTVVKWGNL